MRTGKRELQRRIAYDAARILTELRSDNIAYACQKAAAKYGVTKRQLLPTREEVESALREQQRLLRGEGQADTLQALRQSALGAMQALHQFHPKLVGAVFDGTADSNSRVRLHLFAETPEELLFALSDMHIPWQEKQHQMQFSDGSRETMPCFLFSADGVGFELTLLPVQNSRNHPLDPLDNQPIQGATIKQLQRLIESPA
ncbi:MAG: hypothetical protein KME56_01890 [Candidatus Thiodiazotropha sp. (ex Ctena orbiculata)]|nr:hypothetical protein [Candidatus Thiodiazotropha taylori]PUB88387.1 MAG: hypothetical protein DBP00_05925 [gamma proteobacterium symbiont of Ctena orbiculata]MBT2995373.1 hypothetical protein [Candidatus Thiodiazotropha taylori]MBT3001833.1 hypothetical protein [Candidatus Thiodiazotropha taylori]MBV2108391.1 hypothetical protein [Candidatus Thiodiazotropha taylori]